MVRCKIKTKSRWYEGLEVFKISEASHSALLVRVAQLAETIADSFTNAEAAEEPIVRVSTVVVDCSAVTLVVTAGFASLV